MREANAIMRRDTHTAPALKMHALYVAGAGNPHFLDTERDCVCATVLERFQGFNVQEATGYFRGNAHPCLVVRIATDDTDAVIAVAEQLRRQLAQEAVGLEVDGRYQRITGDGSSGMRTDTT